MVMQAPQLAPSLGAHLFYPTANFYKQ